MEPIKIRYQDERGIIYDLDKVSLVRRKAGTVSGDHIHPEEEVLFLTKGEAEITIDGQVETAKAPAKFCFGANSRHKIKAITDIEFIYYQLPLQ